jgi:ribose transport system ATP-binding protein
MTGNTTDSPSRVEMLGITQRFGDTTVLDDVTLRLAPGEIHALAGQNGAGKSTLMKILGGVYQQTAGSVRIDGVETAIASPRDAAHAGIGMIYQELSLIPTLSVAENIMLGAEPGGAGYSRARMREAARAVVAGVEMLSVLPLDVPAGMLSTGLQQRVEIAKALSRDARVLVMDEPTARLSGPERADLRDLMRQLSGRGIAIVYISHFLEEIFEVCSSLTVLRNGRVVDTGPVSGFTVATLTRAMLNEELAREELEEHREDRALDPEVLLELSGVGGARIHDVDLGLRRGEVVGLAGLVGSGRTRLSMTIAGAEPVLAGTVRLKGRDARVRSPRGALREGIVMIPENRKTDGIIGALSARFNMIGMALDRGMARAGVIDRKRRDRAARAMFDDLQIRPGRPLLDAQWFSGGNQQKILLARALLASPALIVADQPTAGVDVGTKAQIHHLIRETSEAGTGFVIASDDLDELLALCDTVLVMKNGRVVSRHRRSELTRAGLVRAISGEA